MSTRNKLLAVLLLIGIASMAKADGINQPGSSGSDVGFIEGVYNYLSSAVASTCNGAIDLSTGCKLPMLGG